MTEIDKLIHVMLVLMIVGFVLASAVVMHRVSGNKAMALRSLSLSGWFDRWASVGCLVQLVTGGFLVWRRSYQWTTPWIVVAFVSVSLLAITLMAVGLQKKRVVTQAVGMTKRQQWCWVVLSYLLVLVLVVVIHDAVMKHTVW